MKGTCTTKLSKKKICGKVFTGKNKEIVTDKWSKHNEDSHKDILSRGCTLKFDK